MARRSTPTEGKRCTREHVLADLSANYVEKQALLCDYAAERVRLDYGIDLMVTTFNRRGEVASSRIFFQLKATDRLKTVAGGDAVSCRIERANLLHWLDEAIPVVLVVYDARADIGYWLYIQRHFASLAGFDLAKCGKRVSVTIPCSNVLNPEAMRELARAKNAIARTFQRELSHVLQ
jgi:hypothetical protein